MFDTFLRGDYGAAPTDLPAVALSLLLAFLSGQAIAWLYMATHSGLSYSRAFVISLVLLPVIASLVITVLANNLVTAFGMMAVFAMVRFRNILRDTLDTAYVLTVIGLGMACGLHKFATAVIGALVLSSILGYCRFTGLGARHRYDLILHLQWTRAPEELGDLGRLLERHSRSTLCANRRSLPNSATTELAYRLQLRDPAQADLLLLELSTLVGVAAVTSATAGDESEL